MLAADVAISSDNGYLRFCSASMAGPAEGFNDYVFFTGEETNDVVAIDPDNPGIPTVNEDEKQLVRLIYETYLQEKSFQRTSETINAKGYRTKSYTSRRGKLHSSSPWRTTRPSSRPRSSPLKLLRSPRF